MYQQTFITLGDALKDRFKVERQRGGINSPFNDAVERVRTTITDQNWPFARWCGYLRNIPPFEIQRMIGIAEKSKNPGRHFNWLVKDYRQNEKLQQNLSQPR